MESQPSETSGQTQTESTAPSDQSHGTKIIVTDQSPDGPAFRWQHSPQPKGQEWSAYTFLLVPNPTTDNYGICKTLCFGRTSKEVETEVQAMLDDGRVEKGLPFIRVCPTGMYRYLKAGGDDRDLKESYDLNTKEAIAESSNLLAEKRKREMKEMKEKMDDLRDEAKDERKQDPDSYETYIYHRNTMNMSRQREKQLKSELDFLMKLMTKASKESTRIERLHGNFKIRYQQQFKSAPKDEEAQVAKAASATTGPVYDEPKEAENVAPGKGKEEMQ